MSTGSRSPSRLDEELRLPRPPGVIRRFWARHPIATDVIVAGATLLFSIAQATSVGRVDDTGMTGQAEGAPSAVWWAIGVTVAACVALVWRRRWPLPVFALATVAQLMLLLGPLPTGSPLMMVAIYAVAVYRSSRGCWSALGISCAAMIVASVAAVSSGISTPAIALNTTLGGTIPMLIGALIGINVGNRRRYLEALIDRSRQLLRERDQQAQLAAAAERTRIAREMHDIVSHSLTVVIALSEGAAATSDPGKAREAVTRTAQTARDALSQMRAMLGVLRTGDASTSLVPTEALTFQAAVDAARGAGFSVRMTTAGDLTGLPQPHRLALSRIVQESLTNAMRHAPRSTRIDVGVHVLADRVQVAVRNDGAAGRDASGAGYGLAGLRERAALLGGALQAGPEGEDWWSVRAVLPVHAVAEEAA